MRRFHTTLLAIAVIAVSALFGFADTALSIQYTSDKSKSDSYITYDPEKVPTFTQNQKVYVRIVSETQIDESTDENADAESNSENADGTASTGGAVGESAAGGSSAASMNGASSASGESDASSTGDSSGSTKDTTAATEGTGTSDDEAEGTVDDSASPALLQRASGSTIEESLSAAEDGFYQINTGKVGTYELVRDEEVVMTFRVKAQAGVIYKNGNYYYQDSEGVIRKSAGFLRWSGKLYYVQKGGKIAAGKTFKIGKYTYRAAGNGQIKTGVYKWGKYYYYSDSNGRLKTSKGFVTSGGHRYYVRKGGKIRTGKTFKIGKYTYRAAGNGQIKTGVYKWGSYYYYSSGSGVLRKKAGMISWNGKKYYSRSNGTLYTNRFFFSNAVMYYAGSNGACLTGTFKVGSYTYNANSSGAITSSDRKYMLGVDVSYWQGSNINWNQVKNSGISFAFLRCGYSTSDKGTRQADSTFQTNIRNATAAGLDVGAYYFTQAVTEAEAKAEAKLAIQQVQASGCTLNLPLVIDTENLTGRASSTKLSRAKRTAIVKAFCETVRNAGYTPMIYASTSWLNNNLDMSKLSAYKVWVAQYSDSVSYKGTYQCWQYTSSGRVSGISGKVDLDYWTL